jgi:hypothetical protein
MRGIVEFARRQHDGQCCSMWAKESVNVLRDSSTDSQGLLLVVGRAEGGMERCTELAYSEVSGRGERVEVGSD